MHGSFAKPAALAAIDLTPSPMPRLKQSERNIRTLTKLAGGRSYAITIPIETLRAFDWEVYQKLKLTADQKTKRVIVEEAKP